MTRELLRQERGRSRSLGQLLESVPVRRAPQRRQASPESRELPAVSPSRHRWQTEQLVMLAIPYSCTSVVPSAAWSPGAFQSIANTLSRGRT